MSLEVNGELVPVGGGDPIPLIRDNLVLGRRETCDIPLRFPNISGRHAELQFRNGYWYIKDLNSTNGIKVNGNRVQEKILHPKDEISIGKRLYTIQYEPPAGRTAVEEVEEDIMSQSLLQKAGLERKRRTESKGRTDSQGRRIIDPAEFLLRDDDDDD
jgi:adenylate cyclase